MDFDLLEKELENAIEAERKYQRENDAKFRAVEQRVATYDEFRDIVKASHLKPLEKSDKLADPAVASKNVIWNTVAIKSDASLLSYRKKKEKHFTEK